MATQEKSKLRIVTWVDRKGNKVVSEWMRQLDHQSKKQFDKLFNMLRAEGHNLGRPYVGALGNGLFELRDPRQSGPGFRLYFCWEGDTIVVLLGAGDKGSQEHDIAVCVDRMWDLNAKEDGE